MNGSSGQLWVVMIRETGPILLPLAVICLKIFNQSRVGSTQTRIGDWRIAKLVLLDKIKIKVGQLSPGIMIKNSSHI